MRSMPRMNARTSASCEAEGAERAVSDPAAINPPSAAAVAPVPPAIRIFLRVITMPNLSVCSAVLPGGAKSCAASVRQMTERGSSDRHRGPDRHEAGQAPDVRVAHPDAAVRDAAGDELRLVGAVDADVAAGRPLGEVRRTRAGAERDRPVRLAAVRREAVAHVEAAGGGGGPGTPDAHRGAQGHLVAAHERRRARVEVDVEMRADRRDPAQRGAWDPG